MRRLNKNIIIKSLEFYVLLTQAVGNLEGSVQNVPLEDLDRVEYVIVLILMSFCSNIIK